jgi:hypothetical protein
MPVRTKYVFLRSKSGDVSRALIDNDALITVLGSELISRHACVLTGSSYDQECNFTILSYVDILISPCQTWNAHLAWELESTLRRKPIS